MIHFYLLLPKENVKNIEVVNSYYLQYYILIYFIYFNRYNIIIYNQWGLFIFNNEIEPHNLLLSTTQNTRSLHCTSTFCSLPSCILIEYLVMNSPIQTT